MHGPVKMYSVYVGVLGENCKKFIFKIQVHTKYK